jgi:hypothetical protein
MSTYGRHNTMPRFHGDARCVNLSLRVCSQCGRATLIVARLERPKNPETHKPSPSSASSLPPAARGRPGSVYRHASVRQPRPITVLAPSSATRSIPGPQRRPDSGDTP